ncbi:hypothetical protein SCHIN_v1c04310 [Spiroplasma chinense]|uniref:Uncharacterized protein n=1 Tax=Spiroplasma chinense TaxID=216932 RepID=A0A5B9Y3C4_9MOLU|nr:hypothetical protein [Spiroplasma chinense]QEH61628.1 hypothetical protein SCHIN_v1c04310 [Spiroplasma chinense]
MKKKLIFNIFMLSNIAITPTLAMYSILPTDKVFLDKEVEKTLKNYILTNSIIKDNYDLLIYEGKKYKNINEIINSILIKNPILTEKTFSNPDKIISNF